MSQGILDINITKATLAKDYCTTGPMSPYFIAKLSESNLYTSKVLKSGGKFPQWNESFKLVLKGENTLTIEVFHNQTSVIYL
jgi:hypothetical protein